MKWVHRFGRPDGTKYEVKLKDKIRNYIIGWSELGLDIGPIIENFASKMTVAELIELTSEALGEEMGITLESIEKEDEKEKEKEKEYAATG